MPSSGVRRLEQSKLAARNASKVPKGKPADKKPGKASQRDTFSGFKK